MTRELIRTAVLLTIVAMLFIATGCGSVLSQAVVEQASRDVTVDMVQSDPEGYKGATVIWGGIIVSASNLEETTEIEVLETKLSYGDVPRKGESRGRFIVSAQGYLDTAVYASSRRITVAAEVLGVERRKIGQMDYPYPVVRPLEIRIFETTETDYEEYPSRSRYRYPYYDPYWPYYPSPGYPWPRRPYPYWP